MARLTAGVPRTPLGVEPVEADHKAVLRGTVQHQILEGAAAVGFVAGTNLAIRDVLGEGRGRAAGDLFERHVDPDFGEQAPAHSRASRFRAASFAQARFGTCHETKP